MWEVDFFLSFRRPSSAVAMLRRVEKPESRKSTKSIRNLDAGSVIPDLIRDRHDGFETFHKFIRVEIIPRILFVYFTEGEHHSVSSLSSLDLAKVTIEKSLFPRLLENVQMQGFRNSEE